MKLPLAIGLCCALLAALAAGWTAAHADEPSDAENPSALLEVTFYADAPVCTAGSMMQVHWEIRGGAEPYQATLNGEPVDASSNSAPVPCGPAYDIPTWLRGVVQPPPINIDLTVLDAAGSEATHTLTLNRAPPLPAPRVHLSNGFTEHRDMSKITATARGVGLTTDQTRRYLVRWRPVESTGWTTRTHAATPEPARYDRVLEYETTARGVRFEAVVAQVRSFAEWVTPELLSWSQPAHATTDSEPLDLTARMTHDTITVSWGPAVEGLAWEVVIAPKSGQRRGRWRWETEHIGPTLPYEVTYDGLLPDTVYDVRVSLFPVDLVAPLTTSLQVRTEPAPHGWSREPRRPQNVAATARDGGIEVAWEPPAVGPEREYEIDVWEYGAPRPKSILADAGDRRVFVTDRPIDTTYHVIVRHIGVEDEEAHVILEPLTPPRESVKAMTLPKWTVQYQGVSHTDGNDSYEFAASWDLANEHEIDLVQFRWFKDGYAMTRSTRFPRIAIWTATPGPHRFQARVRDHGGSWSQWSAEQRVSATPQGPPGLDVRERKGPLVVSWQPPQSWRNGNLDDQIDGIRVYVSRQGQPDRVQDVGHSTSAEFPIDADGGEYTVRVAAYVDEFGEGEGRSQVFDQTEGPLLDLYSDYAGPRSWVCDLYAGIPAILGWYVRDGAAPYAIQIADKPEFETIEHHGAVDLDCDPDGGFGELSVQATVTDAYGRSSTSTASYFVVDSRGDDGQAVSEAERWRRMMDGLAFDGLSVHRESLLLSWNRVNWGDRRLLRFRPSFVVGWRKTGTEAWRYRTVRDPKHNCPSSSMWSLTDLVSDTEYDVRIAAYWSQEELAKPERLAWSESLTARTLPASIRATVQRRGADIVVSWPSIPEAVAYLVELDAVGTSWSMHYGPRGMGIEEAVFADVPPALDGSLSVEVTSPPDSGAYWSPVFEPLGECPYYD